MTEPEACHGETVTVQPAEFELIWAAWTEANRRRDISRARSQHEVVDRWKAALQHLSDEQQRLLDQGQWVSGPSSLLSVIGQSRRETYHCRVVAWLMDPTGRHGLGPHFLELFLNACFPDEEFDREGLRRATVSCEVPRSRSRADIVVSLPDATVVIEAKTDADERPRQCDDLYADFGEELNPHFVFMSPRGREPITASGDAKETFRTFSFVQCRNLLEKVSDLPRPGRPDEIALGTVKNYLATMRTEFS